MSWVLFNIFYIFMNLCCIWIFRFSVKPINSTISAVFSQYLVSLFLKNISRGTFTISKAVNCFFVKCTNFCSMVSLNHSKENISSFRILFYVWKYIKKLNVNLNFELKDKLSFIYTVLTKMYITSLLEVPFQVPSQLNFIPATATGVNT